MNLQELSAKRAQALSVQAEFQRFALVVATGIVLPALVHLVPSKVPLGPVLMPLFVPVAIAAYCLPVRSALAAAVLLPFASHALTGMPPAPVALQIAFEGMAFVGVASLTSSRMRWFLSYAASALASRLLGLIYGTAVLGGGLAATASSVALGLVGLSIAAVALPVLFKAYRS